MPRQYTTRQPRLPRTCAVCGDGFTVKASRARERPCTYCSRECFFVALTWTKVALVCERCAAAIARTSGEAGKWPQHYCSRDCYQAARGPVGTACVQCGRHFTARRHDLRDGRKLCSVACRTANQRIGEEDRFWAKVAKSDGCWLWLGARDPRGYGRGHYRSKGGFAHRIAYRLAFGDFDARLHVLHHCDTPPCVRPSHLHLGTHPDNMHEASERRRFPHGEGHSQSRFTTEQVLEIRRRHAQGATQKALAREYGVGTRAIHSIVHRLTWKHVA